MREHLPILGDMVTTLSVAALMVALGLYVAVGVILAVFAFVGLAGCYVSAGRPQPGESDHLIEYLVVVVISVLLAGPAHQLSPWLLVIPGLAIGYIWGSAVAGLLDRHNVARAKELKLPTFLREYGIED